MRVWETTDFFLDLAQRLFASSDEHGGASWGQLSAIFRSYQYMGQDYSMVLRFGKQARNRDYSPFARKLTFSFYIEPTSPVFTFTFSAFVVWTGFDKKPLSKEQISYTINGMSEDDVEDMLMIMKLGLEI